MEQNWGIVLIPKTLGKPSHILHLVYAYCSSLPSSCDFQSKGTWLRALAFRNMRLILE